MGVLYYIRILEPLVLSWVWVDVHVEYWIFLEFGLVGLNIDCDLMAALSF